MLPVYSLCAGSWCQHKLQQNPANMLLSGAQGATLLATHLDANKHACLCHSPVQHAPVHKTGTWWLPAKSTGLEVSTPFLNNLMRGSAPSCSPTKPKRACTAAIRARMQPVLCQKCTFLKVLYIESLLAGLHHLTVWADTAVLNMGEG